MTVWYNSWKGLQSAPFESWVCDSIQSKFLVKRHQCILRNNLFFHPAGSYNYKRVAVMPLERNPLRFLTSSPNKKSLQFHSMKLNVLSHSLVVSTPKVNLLTMRWRKYPLVEFTSKIGNMYEGCNLSRKKCWQWPEGDRGLMKPNFVSGHFGGSEEVKMMALLGLGQWWVRRKDGFRIQEAEN